MPKPTYVLGTATSHDGSACLLKNGRVAVAIEKERVTRVKHDGGNDTEAIEYCLDAEGIGVEDLSLVVQNDNFADFKRGNDDWRGKRVFADAPDDLPIVSISHHLAHAYSTIGTCPFDEFNILILDGCGNAYEDCKDLNCLIPDKQAIEQAPHLYMEKDSFYHFQNNECRPIMKDFSEIGYIHSYPMYPDTTKHSMGGMYAAVSKYCFGGMADPGKVMGLAPYGRPGVYKDEIFDLKDDRVFVNYDWMLDFNDPADDYADLKSRFQYFADIAYWVQKEIERALLYTVQKRYEANPSKNLCYAGGTALNAVGNARVLRETSIENIYVEPAAGDNGLSLGCAYYGWLEILKKERLKHSGSTFFGKTYDSNSVRDAINRVELKVAQDVIQIKKAVDFFFQQLNSDKNVSGCKNLIIQFNIEEIGVYQLKVNDRIVCVNDIVGIPTATLTVNHYNFYQYICDPLHNEIDLEEFEVAESERVEDVHIILENLPLDHIAALMPKLNGKKIQYTQTKDYIRKTAELLAEGKIIGWFQGGCEFGPRALGRRSILADPRNPDARDYINANVKFREDFRPFAPSVLEEDVFTYFKHFKESRYMLLIDEVKDDWHDKLSSIVHADGSCRLQTVIRNGNEAYYDLLTAFKNISGISVVLNTSLNKKGMPIVETPEEALDFFFNCGLDCMVINDHIFYK